MKALLKNHYSVNSLGISVYKLILLYLICTSYSAVSGQGSQSYLSNREIVYVHLNKLVFVAGESIKYKAYLIDAANPARQACSKIIYFTLTSVKDKSQVTWRINLADKSESCYFKIPDYLKSGMYLMNAYTNWMRNSPNSYFSQNLLIMNLSEATPDTVSLLAQPDTLQIPSKRETGLRLLCEKSTFTHNEKVKLDISMIAGNVSIGADLSVSVTAESPFNKILQSRDIVAGMAANAELFAGRNNSSADVSQNILQKNGVPFKYLREDKAFILTGTIRSRKDSSALVGEKILLSTIDSIAPRIIYAKTDSSGGFLFYIGSLYDNKKLFIQLADQSKSNEYFWVIENKLPVPEAKISIPYIFKATEKSFLENAKDIRLIDAIYITRSLKREFDTKTGGVDYFSPPNMVVIPSEFSDLVNFKEITDNIVPIIKFAMRNNTYYLQILNSKTQIWHENSMVLLNGVPFTDLAYIATLGTKDIRRIEVIASSFMLGDITYPGLVSIYTNDNKIPDIYLKNTTISFKNTVINNGEEESGTDKLTGTDPEHYPDFRNNLYWKSGIKINSGESKQIEIPVSLFTGKYIISVQGLTTEGKPVSASASFEVNE